MIQQYWRSFSLRAALIIFVAFCSVLFGMQLLIYARDVERAKHNMTHAIQGYKKELLAAVVRLNNDDDLLQHVQSNIEESSDDNLIVALANPALQPEALLVGNIDAWPTLTPTHTPLWYNFSTIYDNNTTPAQAQGQLIVLPNGWQALIGYDLAPIAAVKSALWLTLAENVVYALLAALLLSGILVLLLNRHLRRINNAFHHIKHGHLNYRMVVHNKGDEFNNLARHFNATMDWLNTLLLMIQESSNALAHDMRTPLSRLRLELATLITQPYIEPSTRRALEKYIDKLDDLITMFDSVLNIAKAETHGSRALFERLDFVALVQNILDFYQPLIEEHSLTLTYNVPSQALYMQGDNQMLSQMVMNILDNACKYTSAGGSIFVTIDQQENNIICTIADTGGGVPDDLLPKLCARFVRADKSRHTKGHGLGLSLVQAVAHLHGGSVALRNTDKGLEVLLQLPMGGG